MSQVFYLRPDHQEISRQNSRRAFRQLAESLGYYGWELEFSPRMHLIHTETGETITLPKKATFRSAMKALTMEASPWNS